MSRARGRCCGKIAFHLMLQPEIVRHILRFRLQALFSLSLFSERDSFPFHFFPPILNEQLILRISDFCLPSGNNPSRKEGPLGKWLLSPCLGATLRAYGGGQ